IPDPRLPQVAATVHAKKVTPAAIRVVDVPGTGAQLLGNLRQVDLMLAVLDGWSGTRDPSADYDTLMLELLAADREHIERRIERRTIKPVMQIVNGPAGIDLKLEAGLAELSEEEAAAFREGDSALDEVVRTLARELDLITFFTAGEKETRAWTLRRGGTAID